MATFSEAAILFGSIGILWLTLRWAESTYEGHRKRGDVPVVAVLRTISILVVVLAGLAAAGIPVFLTDELGWWAVPLSMACFVLVFLLLFVVLKTKATFGTLFDFSHGYQSILRLLTVLVFVGGIAGGIYVGIAGR